MFITRLFFLPCLRSIYQDERRFDKLNILSIAPIVAKAISEVFEDGSVTSMFEGTD